MLTPEAPRAPWEILPRRNFLQYIMKKWGDKTWKGKVLEKYDGKGTMHFFYLSSPDGKGVWNGKHIPLFLININIYKDPFISESQPENILVMCDKVEKIHIDTEGKHLVCFFKSTFVIYILLLFYDNLFLLLISLVSISSVLILYLSINSLFHPYIFFVTSKKFRYINHMIDELRDK